MSYKRSFKDCQAPHCSCACELSAPAEKSSRPLDQSLKEAPGVLHGLPLHALPSLLRPQLEHPSLQRLSISSACCIELRCYLLWETFPPCSSHPDLCPEHRSGRRGDHAVPILTSLLDCKLLEGRAQVLLPFVCRISGTEPDIVGAH